MQSTCANNPQLSSALGTAEWAVLAGSGDRSFAPFVVTNDAQCDRIVALASVTSDDVVCDLGFGDASFLLNMAAQTGCRCIGCEVNGDLVAAAADRVAGAGEVGSRVALTQELISTFVESAAFLESATVIYVALVPSTMAELEPVLLAALERPGVRVVSQRFEASGLAALLARSIDGGAASPEGSYFSDGGSAFLYERAVAAAAALPLGVPAVPAVAAA